MEFKPKDCVKKEKSVGCRQKTPEKCLYETSFMPIFKLFIF